MPRRSSGYDAMAYDRERIGRITGQIERYLKDLDLFSPDDPSLPGDRIRFYALSMVLFSLLDSLIDLGSEIVAAHDLGMPATYRQTFALLAQGGFIGEETLRTMSVLVSYRNRLAHEYGEITPADLVALLSYRGEIRTFVEKMKEIVREDKTR
ncbi:MAG: DUF86 domain-containing protein [Methanolinea sp.]|nr:DUF86 domain-containing protein [Methanolinea sp.]